MGMINTAYEQGKLQGDLNSVQQLALRIYLQHKEYKKNKFDNEMFEAYYYGFMQFTNPTLYNAIEEAMQEKDLVTKAPVMSAEDFMAQIEMAKNGE